MNQLLLASIFVIELVNYSLGLLICFGARRKWLAIDICGFVVYAFVIFTMRLQLYEFRLIMNAIILIILIVTLQERISIRAEQILMTLFLIIMLEGILNIPINHISVFRDSNYVENMNYLCSSLMTMGILLVILYLIKHKQLAYIKRMKCFKRWIPTIVLIMAIFLLFTIAGLNYANTQLDSQGFSIFVLVVSIIAFISVGFLGIFSIYLKNTYEKMELLFESERKLMKMSINNYELLLEKEEDTRRYRHDMKNHLICLKDLVENQKLNLFHEYIDKMQGQMKVIQASYYHCGNEVLDAVLNYYVPMIADDVKITVSGCWPEHLNIENIDLCTIFSNLIQNAIEGLSFEGAEEKYLKVHINQGNDYLEVIICNSISLEQKNQKNSLLKSTKPDSMNHGIGLRNVRDTVKKNLGQFQISIKDQEVISQVIFRI